MMLLPTYALVYEILGRRVPIAFALVSTCAALFLFPRVAPNFVVLVALRALIGLNNTLVVGCPLITDSIKKESRGRAISLQTFSLGIAQAFANMALIPLTIDMTYDQSFALCAGTMAILSFAAIFMMREPNSSKLKNLE